MEKRMSSVEMESVREHMKNDAQNEENFEGDNEVQTALDLNAVKPEILKRLRKYIEQELPDKSKKKYAKTLEKILEATAEKIDFGVSPSYEMGYVYGNVSAKGKDYVGDTTYYQTFSVDLETPEKPFFKNGDYDTCWAACSNIARLRKAAYTLYRGKYTWRIYRCDEESEALKDYADEVCGEQFRRVDYELTDTRVNDATYVQTTPHRDCHFYPIYLPLRDKKGKETKIRVGYYNADNGSTDFDIDFAGVSDSGLMFGIIGIICIALALIVITCLVGKM